MNESLRNNTIPCNQEVYKVIQNKIEHFSNRSVSMQQNLILLAVYPATGKTYLADLICGNIKALSKYHQMITSYPMEESWIF